MRIEGMNIFRPRLMDGCAARSAKVLGILAALAAVAMLPTPAVAGLELKYLGFTGLSISTNEGNLNAGVQNIQVSLDSGAHFSSTIAAYCVDLNHFQTSGPYGITVDHIANLTGTTMFTPKLTGGNGAAVGYLYDTYASSATTAILQAALQLAIWRTEYSGFTYSNANNLTPESQAATQADLEYAAAVGKTGDATWYQPSPVGAGQGLVGPAGGSYGVQALSTPEPSTILMGACGGIGWLGVALLRRRRAALAA
jgi:hypothetical protein